MIESPLLALVRRRTASIATVDETAYSREFVANPANWPVATPSLAARLKRPRGTTLRVLAEIKKKSPLSGQLTADSARDLCARYVGAGCHGISILTDPANFGGHASDLAECSHLFPDQAFLFKDFVTTEYQVRLARTCGASAVLLMTQVLADGELKELFALAVECGLEPFVEVHDATQLERALALKPPIIGVNARDFDTPGMPIDLGTMPRLFAGRHDLPQSTVYVAQSGLSSAADVAVLEDGMSTYTADAIQVGSSLSKEGGVPTWLTDLLKG